MQQYYLTTEFSNDSYNSSKNLVEMTVNRLKKHVYLTVNKIQWCYQEQ